MAAVMVLAGGTLVPVAVAGIPPEPQISVEPADAMNGLFLAPGDGAITLTIEALNGAGQPVAFAPVTFEIPEPARFCLGNPPLTATDHNGIAQVVLHGGGCVVGLIQSVRVRVSGVTVRAYSNSRSPDYDGKGPDGRVDLPDLLTFSGEFLGTSGGNCHDYDDSGNTGLEDLVLFVQSFLTSSECVLQP